MNSFLDLHTSADYRNTNRLYYKSTWEYINAAPTYLIPFQFNVAAATQDLTITAIDTDDAETDITSYFYGASLTTAWQKTGTGTWSSTGTRIIGGTAIDNDYQTSNTFTLTAGDVIFMGFDATKYSSATGFSVTLLKGVTSKAEFTIGTQESQWYEVAETGSDYTIQLLYEGSVGTVVTNTPDIKLSTINISGTYRWYDGTVLSSALSGILRLKVESSTETWYSDWISVDTFTDKTKIKISSSYDYGTIKYVGGYEQWMYKNAVVRRAPTAEIEITGDKLNGEIVEEKKVAAIRYKVTMKCTESEYEALVHAMGGTLEITDATGRVFNAVNIELTDPTWYSSNGIVELSFVDSNNINVWTMNNSNL